MEWGVIKEHLDSPTFKKERFDLDKWIVEIKECSNCMAGIECAVHKIKFKEIVQKMTQPDAELTDFEINYLAG